MAVVDRLRVLHTEPDLADVWSELAHPERLWLAAVILDASGDDISPVVVADR